MGMGGSALNFLGGGMGLGTGLPLLGMGYALSQGNGLVGAAGAGLMGLTGASLVNRYAMGRVLGALGPRISATSRLGGALSRLPGVSTTGAAAEEGGQLALDLGAEGGLEAAGGALDLTGIGAPLGLALGAAGFALPFLGSLFGGGSSPPAQQTSLQQYGSLNNWGNLGSYLNQFRGLGTPLSGTYVPGQMTMSQVTNQNQAITSGYRSIQGAAAQQAVTLVTLNRAFNRLQHQVETHTHKWAVSTGTLTQLNQTLQQMMQTNPFSVRTDMWGNPIAPNRGAISAIAGIYPGESRAQQLGAIARTTEAAEQQRNRLYAAAQRIARLVPSTMQAEVYAALGSGEPNQLAALQGRLTQLTRSGHPELVAALQSYSQIAGQGGTMADIRQQLGAEQAAAQQGHFSGAQVQAAIRHQQTWDAQFNRDFNDAWTVLYEGRELRGPLPAGAKAAETAWMHAGSPMDAPSVFPSSAPHAPVRHGPMGRGGGFVHRVAANARARGGGRGSVAVRGRSSAHPGAVTATPGADHITMGAEALLSHFYDVMTGPETVRHLEDIGPYWAHYLATGMDTNDSYQAVDAAARGILGTILNQWGDNQAQQGAQNAGQSLVLSFATGLDMAGSGQAGHLADQAMYNLGFNIAWSVAQGAQAGAGGALGGGAGGSFGQTGTGGYGSLFAKGTQVTIQRHDQGRDIQEKPNAYGQYSPIYANGDGYCVRVRYNPTGFGDAYPICHFTSGPWAGEDVYFGHCKSLVKQGQRFKKGQAIAQPQAGSGPYVGNAKGLPGWAEIGLAPGGVPEPNSSGSGPLPSGLGGSKGTVLTAADFGGHAGTVPSIAGVRGAAHTSTHHHGATGQRPIVVQVFIDSLHADNSRHYERTMHKFTQDVGQAMLTAMSAEATQF